MRRSAQLRNPAVLAFVFLVIGIFLLILVSAEINSSLNSQGSDDVIANDSIVLDNSSLINDTSLDNYSLDGNLTNTAIQTNNLVVQEHVIGAMAFNVSSCTSGNLTATCYINNTYTATAGETISANNIVIQNGGSIKIGGASATSATISLTGTLTIESGGNITASGNNCASGTCVAGSNVTINAVEINLTSGGNMFSQGGSLTASGAFTAGAGGTLNIVATTMYFDGNVSVDGGHTLSTTSYGTGGIGGTIQITISNNLAINGNIAAQGGYSRYDNTGICGNGGIFIFNNPNVNLTMNGQMDLNKGAYSQNGVCAWSNSTINASTLTIGTAGNVKMQGTVQADTMIVQGTFGGKGNVGLRYSNPGSILNINIINLNLTSTGILDSSGGNTAGGASTYYGGGGGTLNIVATTMYFDGNVSVDGGDGPGGSTYGNGGDGGTLNITTSNNLAVNGHVFGRGGISRNDNIGTPGNGGIFIFNNPNVNLTMNGQMDLNGGEQSYSARPDWQNSTINASTLTIGTAGNVKMQGTVQADTMIVQGTFGGKATNGRLYQQHGGNIGLTTNVLNITSTGILDSSGGSATVTISLSIYPGNGGTINITSGVTYLDGIINVSGGSAASGVAGNGAPGGTIILNSPIIYQTNTSSIIISGGNHGGTTFGGSGGNGGTLNILTSSQLDIKGAITGIGGTADADGSATRGNGGVINLNTNNNVLTINSTINLNRGAMGLSNAETWGNSIINASNVTILSGGNVAMNGTVYADYMLIQGTFGGAGSTSARALNTGNPGGTITINSNILNLTGTMTVVGGNALASNHGDAGNAGTIIINSPIIYQTGIINLDGGDHGGTTYNGAGGNAGTLQIITTNNLAVNGNITARGGTADSDGANIRGNGGTFVFNNPNVNLTINSIMAFDRGEVGLTNNGYGGNLNITADVLNISATITSTSNGLLNGTTLLGFNTNFYPTASINPDPTFMRTTSYGQMKLLQSSVENSTLNYADAMNVSQNNLSINSVAYPQLNKSAQLTFYNLSINSTVPLRNGVMCPISICNLLSSSQNGLGYDVSINVTGFSDYSMQDPAVNIVSPANYAYVNSTQNYIANVTSLNTLTNSTLILMNSTNDVVGTNYTELSGGSTQVNFSLVFPYQGTYSWNYYVCANTGCGYAYNYNYTIYNDITPANGTLLYPSDNTHTDYQSNQNFTLNVTDNYGLQNATLNLFDGINQLVNQTTVALNGATTAVIGVVVNLVDGVYSWFWGIFDLAGNYYQTENRTITVDTIGPNITLELNNPTAVEGYGYYQHLKVIPTAPYNSLVGYWSFDGDNSTTAFDLTANNNDGVYTSGAYSTKQGAIYGSTAQFDGVDDYVNLGTPTSLDIGPDDITLTGWIYVNGYTSYAYNYIYSHSGTSFWGVAIIKSTKKIIFANATTTLWTSNYVVPDKTWVNFALVKNSTGAVWLYINGSLVDNSTGYDIPSGTNTYNRIGHVYSYEHPMNGSIDEVMIFNTSLNSTQILDIYNNQSARFYNRGEWWLPQLNVSAGGNIAQLAIDDYSKDAGSNLGASLGTWDISKGYNDDSSPDPNDVNYGLVAYYHADNVTGNDNVVTGQVGNALSFDATNDYLTSSSITAGSNNTFAFWAKCKTANPADKGFFNIGNSYYYWSGTGYLAMYNGASYSGNSPLKCSNTDWNYWAVARNDTNFYIYLNGAYNSTLTLSGMATSGAVVLNANANLGKPLGSYFDEFRVWNATLSAEDINRTYQYGLAGQTVPTEDKNITNLVLEYLFDKNATSLWATMTPDTSGNEDHGIMFNMLGANVTESISGSTTSQGFNGTNLLSAGKYNQSFTFDGNSYVGGSTVNYSTYSICSWINVTSGTRWNVLLGNRGTGIYGFQFGSHTTAGFQPQLTTSYNNVESTLYCLKTSQPYNVWQHYCWVRDGSASTANLYINGVNQAGVTTSSCGGGGVAFTGFAIGKAYNSAGMGLSGSMDEVMIWNRSLTASEVSDLYSRGRANWQYTAEQNVTEQTVETFNYSASSGIVSCWLNGITDECGGGNDGAFVGGANWSNTNRGTIGNLTGGFDGDGDYVNVSTTGIATATAGTISALVKKTYGTDGVILGMGNTTGTSSRLGFFITSANKLRYFSVNDTGYATDIDTTNAFVPTDWHHVVGVISSGSVTLYVDGVSQATTVVSGVLSSIRFFGDLSGNKFTTIGSRRTNGTDGLFMNGYIDDVAIWNRALSASEVQSIYLGTKQGRSNNTFAVSTTTTNVVPRIGFRADSNGFYTPWIKATNFTFVRTFLDSNVPNGSLVLPVNNTYTNSSMNFTLNATDNYGLGNATLNFVNNSGQVVNQTTYVFGQDTLQATIGIVAGLVDGIYTWFWNIWDLAGNMFTVSENRTITFDTVKPVVSFSDSNPANGSARKDWFYVNVTIVDSGFGYNDSVFGNVSYNWNGSTMLFTSANVSNFVNLGNGNWEFVYNQSGLVASDGDYYYNVTIYDLAGNVNSSETRWIKGNTPPTVNFTGNSNSTGNWSQDYIFAEIRADDVDENMDIAVIYLFDSNGNEINRTSASGSSTLVLNVSWPLADGIYYVNASVNDTQGEGAVSETRRIMLDTALPNATALVENNHYSPNSGNNFSVVLRDNTGIKNASLYIYNITGGLVNLTAITNFGADTVEATVGVVVNLVDGVYTWFYELFDWAGNRGVSENRTITVDTVKPVVRSVGYSPMNNVYNESIDPGVRIYVNATITDNVAGVNSTILRVYNGSDWSDLEMGLFSGNDTNGVWNVSFVTQATDTTYLFYVNATDRSGNWNISGNYSFESAWDCSWNMSLNDGADLGQFFGFNEKKNFVNFTIYNTGDVGYNDSCPLNFIVSHNLLKSGQGSLRIDDSFGESKGYENIIAGGSVNVKLYFTYRNEIYSDDLNLTIFEDGGKSEIVHTDSLVGTMISTSGPYLYQAQLDPVDAGDSGLVIRRNSTYYEIYLSNQTIIFNSSIRNGVGDGTPEMAAYNVSHSWLFDGLFNFSYVNDSSFVDSENGSMEFYYENISDGVSGENHYNAIELNLSDFVETVSRNQSYLFELNSFGFNQSGGQIVHANNVSVLNNSFSVRFLCYPVSDGFCVRQCDKDLLLNGSVLYDPDCAYCGNGIVDDGETCSTCPADAGACPVVVTTPGGGGGGGGGSGGATQTKIDYTFVRGQTNEIVIPFENRDSNDTMKNLKFTITGDIAKYVELTPSEIDALGPGEEKDITLKITSPSYLKLGKQEILISITGMLGFQSYNEDKIIVLQVVEISNESAVELINGMEALLDKMRELNLSTENLDNLLNESRVAFNELHYEKIVDNNLVVQETAGNALNAYSIVSELDLFAQQAHEKGIKTDGGDRLLKLAQLSLQRGEYAEAYARAKEAQVTYALEYKGEIGKASYYLKKYPREISLSAVFFALLIFTGFKVGQVQLLRSKIKKLKNEEKIFQGLMRVVQTQAFEKKAMSMEEYEQSMKYYESRLSEIIEQLIECESKRVHALRFTSGETRLKQERQRIIDLIKEIQKMYLQQGKMETKAYEIRLESYNKRLGTIDEHLANLEAKRALKSRIGFKGLFGGKKWGL